MTNYAALDVSLEVTAVCVVKPRRSDLGREKGPDLS